MSQRPARRVSITAASTSEEEYVAAQAQAHQFELSGDLYTNALMYALEVPGMDDKASMWRIPKKVVPVVSMLVIAFIQLTMSWAVYLHVQNSMIGSNTRPLLTAYEMFVGSNITIPLHTVEALCGEWEDHEMKDFSKGPLSLAKMPDGSVYSPDDSYSLFYNVKQPTRTWDYKDLGSHRSVLDDSLFLISSGLSFNPFTPSGYSLLFILTMCIFYLTILIDVREVFHFAFMLIHFLWEGCETGPCFVKGESGKYAIEGISVTGQVVGWIAVVCRLSVAIVLALLGSLFLIYTTLKIDLILNGLALVFLLELGQMVYWSSVPDLRQQWIKDLDPVAYSSVTGQQNDWTSQILPILMGPISFTCAVLARWNQIKIYQNYFRLTAAICLFAGPTTPFARHDIVHPVAGFCDSLLGVKCAPHVTPIATAQEHGYCHITDQTTLTSPTVQFYLDDPKVFSNRYFENGTMTSWVDWGEADSQLYKSGLWVDGPYQDLLRKNCLQMYQKTVKPDDVLVDDDKGETMDGAPFQCKRDALFKAVFGEVFNSLDKMPIEQMMEKVADLRDPAVVSAMDNCKHYFSAEHEEVLSKQSEQAEQEELDDEDEDMTLQGGAAPAPAAEVAVLSPIEAPAPSPAIPSAIVNSPAVPSAIVNFKAVSRHRQHHLRHSQHWEDRSHTGAWWWPHNGAGAWWWPQADANQGEDLQNHIVVKPYAR